VRRRLTLYCLVLFLVCCAPACADSITLTSSNQDVTFTGLGPGIPLSCWFQSETAD
jgi:hypothetical protein